MKNMIYTTAEIRIYLDAGCDTSLIQGEVLRDVQEKIGAVLCPLTANGKMSLSIKVAGADPYDVPEIGI